MSCACTHTLSKREIFMAFIVAESTNIGGPSSNTSLMNSLPLFKIKIQEDQENTSTNTSAWDDTSIIQILTSGQSILDTVCSVVWNMFHCLMFTCEMLQFSISTGYQPDCWLLSNQLLVMAFFPPTLHIILNQVLSGQADRSSLCLSAVSDCCYIWSNLMFLQCK